MSRDRGGNEPRRESEPNVIHLYGVRGRHLSIFQKKIWDGDTEADSNFEATWITEEDSKYYDRNLKAIEDAIAYVLDTDKAVKGKGDKRGFIEPLLFGADTGLPVDDFGKDVFVVKSKKKHKRPRIIDGNSDPIMQDDPVGKDDMPIKSGDYFDVILRLYGYDNKSVGINCEIMLIRFRKSGEELGGGREYTGDDFEAPDEDFELSNGGGSRSDRGSRGRNDERGRGRNDDRRDDERDDDRSSRRSRGSDEDRGSRRDGAREEGRSRRGDSSDSGTRDGERGRGSDRRSRSDRSDDGDDRDSRDDRDERDNDRGRGRDDNDRGSDRGSRRGRSPDPDRDNDDGYDSDNDGDSRRSRGRGR